ncbi:hypothetical protein A3F37_00885 [Candidatus Saccharibacteria bacterium RIFCSPHIGHO2_12_FULL_41_12]|nr:MAG: hypothetical protein A3F37_00885 [Candidatus Saccharibacteria bacterium RIFCSPHIGHO2_12_FULL_41_12]
MSGQRPSKKQFEIINFIDVFIKQHGYGPSYREVMSGLGYSSVATVSVHINNLITKGLLTKKDHSARSLSVVKSDGPTVLPTNQIESKDEKWLVDKIEYFFRLAEDLPDQDQVDNLYVLIGALKVLGLNEAAQSFMPRLSELKKRV